MQHQHRASAMVPLQLLGHRTDLPLAQPRVVLQLQGLQGLAIHCCCTDTAHEHSHRC